MAVDQRDRQSHDIEVTALDAFDKLGSPALNSVSAGFIQGFAGVRVGLDFLR